MNAGSWFLKKQYMMNMGNKMTAEELEELMKEADPKGDGAVDIADFAERMCPPKKWNKFLLNQMLY